MGFKIVKLRIHDPDLQKDIEQIKAVREAVGDSMEINVDANQRWPVTIIKTTDLGLSRAVEYAF